MISIKVGIAFILETNPNKASVYCSDKSLGVSVIMIILLRLDFFFMVSAIYEKM